MFRTKGTLIKWRPDDAVVMVMAGRGDEGLLTGVNLSGRCIVRDE